MNKVDPNAPKPKELRITKVELLDSLLENTTREVKFVIDVNKLDKERCKKFIKIIKENKGKEAIREDISRISLLGSLITDLAYILLFVIFGFVGALVLEIKRKQELNQIELLNKGIEKAETDMIAEEYKSEKKSVVKVRIKK